MSVSITVVASCRSWKLVPTAGRSTFGSMPTERRWLAGPIPESMSSCGELKQPPARMTSLRARMVRRRLARWLSVRLGASGLAW
ncbi:hypothetical protein GCM10027055_00880 [Janibacter alkaliphilus]